MFELKLISTSAIPAALEKVERYRLLNEPNEAESICRDILQVDPENQQVLVLLLLSLTDQFGPPCHVSMKCAQDLLSQLDGEYERAYYAGVILERWGKAQLQSEALSYAAFDWLREAMRCYDEAEAIHPPGNAEAILRWNTCARMINKGQGTATTQRPPASEAVYDDEVPLI